MRRDELTVVGSLFESKATARESAAEERAVQRESAKWREWKVLSLRSRPQMKEPKRGSTSHIVSSE